VQVTVLDRAAGPARETSFANGSLLTPSLADPWNAPGVFMQLLRSVGRDDAAMLLHLDQLLELGGWGVRFLLNSRRRNFQASYLANVRLARFSQEAMAEILAASPVAFDFARRGILKVFENHSSLGNAIKVAHWLKQVGIEHRVLDAGELADFEPALHKSVERLIGGIHYPGDEVGDARRFCEGLADGLAAAGVTFAFDRPVLDFEVGRGRILSLATPHGPVHADAFVLAAGSFSPELARKLKVKVPVVPAKGYSITLPAPVPSPRLPVVDDGLHAAVVPLGDDRLRVAGTAEFAGYDDAVRPERIANLVGLLNKVMPGVEADPAQLEAWTGLRPMTPDGRPILGACAQVENLHLNTGHGALGWTLACGSGKVVAEAVMGQVPSCEITPFRFDRF
jgi:D-amino-acid dehydrogenase